MKRSCSDLVTPRKERVHREVGEPVKVLKTSVDTDLGCEVGMGELVDNLKFPIFKTDF